MTRVDPGRAVDERDVRLVERREVLVVEERPLAQVPVVRLERLGHRGVVDDLLDARAGAPPSRRSRTPRPRARCSSSVIPGSTVGLATLAMCCGPPVVDEVDARPGARSSRPRSSPSAPSASPEPELRGELGLGRMVAAHADRRRRALEHVHVLRGLRRAAATPGSRCAPLPTSATDLVGELRHVRVGRAPAGVRVVPAGGVERLALEVLHPRDHRHLHEVEDADAP